jgi:Protein of unknown function (DUF4241)
MIRNTILLLAAALGSLTGCARPAPGEPPPHAPLFEWAFRPGFTVSVNEADTGAPERRVPVGFRTLALGKVGLPSGRVIACDPFVSLGQAPPFTQAVPKGDFPVELAVIAAGESDGRIAFARVVFSPEPAVSWRMALIPGQDLSALKPGEVFGYGVDAGTGSFFSPEASAAATALLDRDGDAWEAWQTAGEANGARANLKPNYFLMLPMPPANIAMFASGWGDGFYTSWFGFSADGAVVSLVTDFGIIDQSVATWQPPR